MYIVSQGLVLVLGGVDKKSVLATLGPGSIFGEIRYNHSYSTTMIS